MPHSLVMCTQSVLLLTAAAQDMHQYSVLLLAARHTPSHLKVALITHKSRLLSLAGLNGSVLLLLPLQPPLDTPPGMGPAARLTAPEGAVHPPPSQGIRSQNSGQ